ncbi:MULTISPECIES: DUF1905 domain-containing protein [unclassified Lentilitoribacter]|jgi:hypothetical protein|uniref:DUF1905 domain-containing protein n=1 Tax=unclassified Lentilitoribacter TaxID=2647570 RepID=UPI0018D8E881|nr:DUF1905 domain-containing protein [Lentilitoribacter sp. Alg239-R112]
MISDLEYAFETEMWRSSGGSWYFMTVPQEISQHISSFCVDQKTSFGSVRVKVRVGETSWKTSLFPDKASGCYFLPIKADIRKREKLAVGPVFNINVSVDV